MLKLFEMNWLMVFECWNYKMDVNLLIIKCVVWKIKDFLKIYC